MWAQYLHKNIKMSIVLPDDENWFINHVTKHFIDNYENEGWNLILDINLDRLYTIKETSKNFEVIKNSYLNHIKNAIENDHQNPRNASYEFLDTPGKKHIVIIDDMGFSIILRKQVENYVVITGYGHSDRDTRYLPDTFFKFSKLFSDKQFRLNAAIMEWNGRFDDILGPYTKVDRNIINNWEISQ